MSDLPTFVIVTLLLGAATIGAALRDMWALCRKNRRLRRQFRDFKNPKRPCVDHLDALQSRTPTSNDVSRQAFEAHLLAMRQADEVTTELLLELVRKGDERLDQRTETDDDKVSLVS